MGEKVLTSPNIVVIIFKVQSQNNILCLKVGLSIRQKAFS